MDVHDIAGFSNAEGTIDRVQRAAFDYFEREAHLLTGLIDDSSVAESKASIAGSGMALACYVVAADRGYLTRSEAARRTLTALQFLQGSATNGFFYHFLDPNTGERAGECEVSTIDSALLFAGALTAVEYFDNDDESEREIRSLGTNLYLAADWTWASPRAPAVSHGWTPERGFIKCDWRGYNEALLLYILALGSPTHPIDAAGYDQWLASYKWKRIYGYDLVYSGPLFIHQMTHAWIDMRGIQDSFMRGRGIDYFENSRRATYVQRAYAMRNPRSFAGYSDNCWGFSASMGPESGRFPGYRARGAPFGPDDGTIAPWATAASLPFAPEIVLPALEHMSRSFVVNAEHGLGSAFNHTCAGETEGTRWIASHSFAIDQGPVVLMAENFRTGLIWRLMRRSPYIRRGLERAGFSGGWLDCAD